MQYTLANISKGKGNQTIKFGQLEYNMRNTFVEKLYGGEEVVEKLFPDPFLRNQNWVYLCIDSHKVLYSLFLMNANLRAIEI